MASAPTDLQQTNNGYWNTMESVCCTMCRKAYKTVFEIKGVDGLFCNKHLQHQLNLVWHNNEFAEVRGICDMLFETRKVTRKIERSRITNAIRYEVLKKAKFKCKACGVSASERELQVDHIIAVSNGGTSDLSNLQALCVTCNSGKSNKL